MQLFFRMGSFETCNQVRSVLILRITNTKIMCTLYNSLILKNKTHVPELFDSILKNDAFAGSTPINNVLFMGAV